MTWHGTLACLYAQDVGYTSRILIPRMEQDSVLGRTSSEVSSLALRSPVLTTELGFCEAAARTFSCPGAGKASMVGAVGRRWLFKSQVNLSHSSLLVQSNIREA